MVSSESGVEAVMQDLIDRTFPDRLRFRVASRSPATSRHTWSRRNAVRIHDKIFGGVVFLMLLLAYDMASRIDEHIGCFTSAPLSIDDSSAATNRF